MSPLLFSATCKMFSSVVTKISNDHKPPQASTNDHKAPANDHQRPNRVFPNSNDLIFLQVGNWAELDRCK